MEKLSPIPKFALIMAALIFVLPFSAIAQEEEDFDFAEMSLEDLLNVEVTVASKTEETVADAPSTVTVYSRQEIQAMGITTLSELLNYVPGFQAAKDVENGQLSAWTSRGRRNGTLGPDILVLINGRRINNAHTGGATYINRLITLDNIKQVEIIRGPGSALYGSNAFLGVVNMVTVDNVKEVNVKAGSLSYRDAYATHYGQAGTWNFSAFVRAFSDDGEVYQHVNSLFRVDTETTDPREGFDFYADLHNKKWRIDLRHQERELRDYYVFSRIYNGLNHENTSQSSLNVKYSAINNDHTSLDIQAGATKSKLDQLARLVPDGIPIFFEGDFIGGPYLETSYYNFNIDYQHSFNEKTSLSAGASYEITANEDTADRLNYNTRFFDPEIGGFQHYDYLFHFTGDQSFVTEETRKILGLYAQLKQNFTENFKLIIGGRFDDYNDFGNTFNPRGALIYNAPFNSKFKLMYGEAFRAPTFTEQATINNPVVVGNPALEPETVETLEAAWVFKTKAFQSTLTYFDYSIDDVISVVINNNGVPSFDNIGTFETQGFEFEFSAVISQNFLLRAGFASVTDDVSPGVADQSGSIIATVNVNKWSFNINGAYRGDTEPVLNADGSTLFGSIDSFWLFNMGLRFKASDSLSFQANAQNLFDEEYQTFGTIGIPTGIDGRGATYNLGLIFRP